MTQIVVVVLNYKTPELAVSAAQGAAKAMGAFGGAILLVDNASPDNSFETMQNGVAACEWPDHLSVHVLQSGRNGGFGAGNNFGMRAGLAICPDAEYFYILNPDANPEPDAINALVDRLRTHPKAAIAGSWVYNDYGDSVSAFRFPTLASEFEGAIRLGPVTRLLKNYVGVLNVPETSGPVGWIVGASMLVKSSVLDKIGLFDETFFLYFEETDLCLRAYRAGYEVHFVRESRVCHIGSVATGMGNWERTPRYWYESRWYYFNKNHGRAFAVCATLLSVFGTCVWRLRRLIEGKPNTNPKRFTRDLISHDVRALFQPTPGTSIQKMTAEPDAPLSVSVD